MDSVAVIMLTGMSDDSLHSVQNLVFRVNKVKTNAIKDPNKIYHFSSNGLNLQINDVVLVTTRYGFRYGLVIQTDTKHQECTQQVLCKVHLGIDNNAVQQKDKSDNVKSKSNNNTNFETELKKLVKSFNVSKKDFLRCTFDMISSWEEE